MQKTTKDSVTIGNLLRRQLTMKKYFLLLTASLILTVVHGQKQGNIWYFGDHAGVDFNSGIPIALTNGVTYYPTGSYSEGTTAISDSSGQILFYTGGQKLWNKNHLVMANGDSLLGNFSSTQSSIIVPLPGSSRYFYVFTVDDYWESQLKYGFRYSVVDICLDNGLGDVISNQKNILLLDTVAEKIGAVRHSNGVDYWIVTHKLYTDKFYSYKLTSNGITDTVITQIGSTHAYAQGQLKISPNGNRIALAADQSYILPCYFDLFDFDNSSGIISNFISLATPTNSDIYGVEFSPDNSKLYATYGAVTPFGMGIVEYDLISGNQTIINNSMTPVYQNTTALGLRGLQLGPNGKIYQVGILDPGYLLAINSPNNYGASCNVQDSAVFLGGKFGNNGLPTFISGYSYSNTIYNCTEGINEQNLNEAISIFPNPFNSQTTLQTAKYLINASLTVYNSVGQTVKRIDNLSGQTVLFHRYNLPSGLYFVRLTQDGNTISSDKFVITDK
jgi:hypothetical protein